MNSPMTTTCPTCNSELHTSNGQTFCAACLLQQGMKSSTYGGGPRVAWKPPEIEQLTTAFPHLEIQQLLGVGGMGAVFKVRQKELDRIAALKVLPGEMAADAGFTERFLREARLLASLSHPHIVTVYEFGQRDGIYFLLMEFIDGVTLRQALRAEPIKKLASKETLAIVGQLCDALQFAHDEGVVHRDIKPENILIDKRGRVKIADFGLARLLGQSPTMPTLTRTHQLMGTPAYMAPEQIEGLPGIDHRADIYSMGVVFYELLTGELPLGRFSPPSERAETDVRLDEVVLRALAREPDRRYQQASQVKTDVEALSSANVMTNPVAFPSRRRWIGRGVVGFIAGVLVTPVLATVLYFSLEARQRSHAIAQVSERERQAANDYVQKEIAEAQARRAADGSMNQNPMAGMNGGSDAGSGMMSMGGMGGPMSSNLVDTGSAIIFESELFGDSAPEPALNPQLFNLADKHRAAVNKILKETHERYLKEEALHSIVSVDANGVQTTEISAFPDQLRAIENEMWRKLDDAVPVETQKEFRDRLNLYTTEKRSENSVAPGMGGYPVGEMGEMSGMGMGMTGGSSVTGPGFLGWEPEHYPLKMKVSRSGRWFDWSVVSEKSNPGFSAVTELDQGKAPTLPSALQRFYREPGPWMAVANARAVYTAKDWMKLADHFTAEAMIREFLNAKAFGEAMEIRIENDDSATEEWVAKYSQQYGEAVARSPELSEVSGQVISTPEIDVLHLTAASDIDTALANGVKDMPGDAYRKAFALWGLTSAVLDNDEFEFELEKGEVSSYIETGDTAAATLTIPNKPPVPIRFKRVNGQWRIDAIGSNERLLERLKQTKIWKQHAEIEAVLENARTAYAAKEWQKLADCFTRAGKYRWTLQTHFHMSTHQSLPPEGEGQFRMEEFLAESGRWAVQHAAAGKSDDKPLPEDKDGKEWRILFDQFLSCPSNESDALLIKLTEMLPESMLDAMFASTAIQSVLQPPEVYRFDFDGCRVTDMKVTDMIATANLVRKEDEPPERVRLLKQNGDWKIDIIGTPEQIQLRVQTIQERQNGASPRAAVEAFREAMADGRFETALNCMTEDARNEWLGEMLAGLGFLGLMNTTSEADFTPGVASRFEWSGDLSDLRHTVGGQLHFVVEEMKDLVKLRDRSLAADQRRKLAIALAIHIGNAECLRGLLGNRELLLPGVFAQAAFGDFEEVPDRTKPDKGAKKYRLQPASPDQQPLDLDFIQVDGLWKLNTIIDAALKPWPLPAEEPTPPAEATPVDGATGVP
jgi:serine/threonine protein kinase